MPSVGAVIHAGPHPSLAVVRNWRGIVELVLRGVAAGLAVIGIIACAAAQDDASDDDIDETLLARSNAAAGWGIFLCFLAFLTEIIIILMRFLNFGFVQNHLTISLVVDICVSASFALLLFITGIPLAVYANEWDDEIEAVDDEDIKDTLERIPPALRAASAFCYISMIGFIVLIVWMVLHLVLGWCKPSSPVSHAT